MLAKSFNSKISEDVQHMSHSEDSSSDSEIKFNCYLTVSLKSVSDFYMTTKSIEVTTNLDSNTGNERESNVSINVASTMKNLDNYNENPQVNTSTEQSCNRMARALDKRERKRWTILEGNDARKSFHMQIENFRRSMIVPKKDQNTLHENNLLIPRRLSRKRVSDVLKKSLSSLDVSIDSKKNFDSKKDDVVTHEVEVNSSISEKSRRSRSLISLKRSSPDGLDNSRKMSSGQSVRLPEQDTSIESNQLGENAGEISMEMKNFCNNDMVVYKSVASLVNKRNSTAGSISKGQDAYDLKESVDNKKAIALNKRERKRWAILERNGAQRSFHIQIKNLGTSMPKNDQNTLQEHNLLVPKRLRRKRWSEELRKSLSSLDVSINCKNNFDSKKNNVVTHEMEVDISLSKKSRRSRSLISLERSIPDGLDDPRKKSSGQNAKLAELADIPIQSNQLDKNNGKISIKMNNISNNDMVVFESLAPSFIKRATPHVRKSIAVTNRRCVSVQTNKDKNSTSTNTRRKSTSCLSDRLDKRQSEHASERFRAMCRKKNTEDTFDVEGGGIDIGLLQSNSLCPSTRIRRSSAAFQKAKISHNHFPNSSKRRTFKIEKTVNGTVMLKPSTISSGNRRSSSLADTLDSPLSKKSFKSYKGTPYICKSNPSIPINDITNISQMKMKPGTSAIKNSLNDVASLPSSSIQNSTTAGSKLNRRDTYKLNESVTVTSLMKKVNFQKSSSPDKREERRTILKGVRSNRRFELLMQMRRN